MRAFAAGSYNRHGGVDPKASGLVRGGRDHAAVARATDNNRFALQLRSIMHLHRGIEGIHVEVDDLSVF